MQSVHIAPSRPLRIMILAFAGIAGATAARAVTITVPTLPAQIGIRCAVQMDGCAPANGSITTLSQSVTPATGGLVYRSGRYAVQLTGTATTHASGSGQPITAVKGSFSYTGIDNHVLDNPYNYTNGRVISQYQSVRDVSASITSIDTELARGIFTPPGVTSISPGVGVYYDYSLTTPDPTRIAAGRSVAVSGQYQYFTGGFATVYGVIDGQSTVTAGNDDATTASGNASPLHVTTTFTTRETTRLDATGLVTPRIVVSNGIAMGNSRITGLAPGTGPTDAVNRSQLIDVDVAHGAAELGLATALAAESQARIASDQRLSNRIAAQQAAATAHPAATVAHAAVASPQLSYDVASLDAVSEEATARQSADTALSTRIDSEASTRAAADARLATSVAQEASTRASADTAMSQEIDDGAKKTAALSTELGQESAQRMAADLALSQRIDTVSARVDALGTRVDRLDARVSGSTAIAVALGGGAFLPDTRFNLTANVGTYRGAQAGAVQVGALVSRHVALNAGAATNFNKLGGTAARAGVTLGW